MSDFRTLSETMLASPQITPADLDEAKKLGVTLVVNNRPEGEAPDQTPGPQIEAAARAAGMDYIAIPIDRTGFSLPQIDALAEALDQTEGKTLGYCRTGTRSTNLWALARARRGADPARLIAAAGAAGYDISGIAGVLEQLAGHDEA